MSARIHTTDEEFFRRGRSFSAGIGPSPMPASQLTTALITNPTSSGRLVVITRLVLYMTVSTVATFRVNPTTGLPATAATIHNRFIGSSKLPVATVKIDGPTTTAMSGGTLMSGSTPLLAQNVVYLEQPFLIEEGNALGITITNTAAGNASGYLKFLWYEDDQRTTEFTR